MIFCPYCGTPLDGATICPKCGADISAISSTPPASPKGDPQSNPSTDKQSSLAKNIPQEKRKFVVAAAVAFMLLVILLFALIPGKKDVIQLTDYVSIDSVSGMDGYGHMEYSFDSYSVYLKLFGIDVKDEQDAEALFSEENLLKTEKIQAVLEGVSVKADKVDNLSNGDKVNITVSFENPTKEKLDFELRGGEISYTVEGLIDSLPFDPFSDDIISVAFTGASGSGEAIVGMVSDNELYNGITYSFSNNYGLSNGDEVILTAVFDQPYFVSLGYSVPDQCSKTYTVSGLKDFFRPENGLSASERTRFEELTMSSVMTDISKDVLAKDMPVLDSEFWSLYYFETKMPGTTFFDMTYGTEGRCGIIGIAKITFDSSWSGTYEDVYFALFPDCMTGEDGHLTYNEDNFVVFDRSVADETEAVEWLGEHFDELTFTKL